MIPFRKTLAFRLLGISFILLSLPLLVDAILIVQGGYKDALGDAKEYLAQTAHEREEVLSLLQPVKRPFFNILENTYNLSENFPQTPSKEADVKLQDIVNRTQLGGIFFLKITPEGRYIAVAGSDARYLNQDFTEIFGVFDLTADIVYERGYVNLISFDQAKQKPFVLTTRVIYDEEKKPLGIVVVSEDITDKLAAILKPNDTLFPIDFAIMLPNTIVMYATDPALQFASFKPVSQSALERVANQLAVKRDFSDHKPLTVDTSLEKPYFEFEWNGKTQIAYEKSSPITLFSLLAYASKGAIERRPFKEFFEVYRTYALILLIGIVLAYVLTRFLGRPFNRLVRVMDAIHQGNFQERYKADWVGYEINTLGAIFNEMVDNLIETRQAAEDERVKRETYEEELRIGQRVQRSLLPETMPTYPGVELAEAYVPAKEVGGDFYDVYVKEDRELVLTIADASGKGVSACFYSLALRSTLRTFVHEFDNVAEILADANRLFCSDVGTTGMFVTTLFGLYNREDRVFRYFSCGHNPPILLRKDGRIELLEERGLSLGIDEECFEAQEVRVQLEVGDILLLYTDGVTEAQNLQFKQFGEEALIEVLKKNAQEPLGAVAERIVEEVNRFAGSAPQHDDITILCMRVVS